MDKISLLYFIAIFSIVSDNIKDDNLQLLKADMKFMKTLSEASNSFTSNHNILNK